VRNLLVATLTIPVPGFVREDVPNAIGCVGEQVLRDMEPLFEMKIAVGGLGILPYPNLRAANDGSKVLLRPGT
jgi:hypothetical protein